MLDGVCVFSSNCLVCMVSLFVPTGLERHPRTGRLEERKQVLRGNGVEFFCTVCLVWDRILPGVVQYMYSYGGVWFLAFILAQAGLDND